MFVVIFIAGRIMVSLAKTKELVIKKRECPPHKWVYKEQPRAEDEDPKASIQEYMICDRCKCLPGAYDDGSAIY